MKYYSTNRRTPEVSLREAVVASMAPDNGLYMPERIERLPDAFFDGIARLDLHRIACRVADAFFGEEIEPETLRRIVRDTFCFDIPVVRVDDGIWALELFHGPTMAFKDVGARFMARILSHFIEGRDDEHPVTVLVATSGDTGGAVANGFLGVEGIDVVVLYPKGRVSDIQEKQFTTLGRNVTALEIEGTFDDCQRLVKSAFADTELKRRMRLTSANSINVARFLPQTFYFFHAYAQLRAQGVTSPIVVSVPSGNFGNLTPIDNTESVKNNQGFLSIGLTMPLTHNSLASLRFNGGQQAYRYDAPFPDTDPDTDLTRFSFFSTKLDIARNTLDKILYTRRGSEISLSGIYITGRERYKPAEFGRKRSFNAHREWFGAKFQWNRYFDLPGCKWFSFGFNIDAVWTTHPRFQTETATLMSLPAYQPVVHSQMAFMPDYRAKNFLAGGLMPTFDLLPNFFLRTGFYAMYRDNRGLPGEKMQYITEASFVYHTPIGPVSLSLTKYDLKSWHNMYLTFNFGYAIFAPSGHFY